MNEIANRPRKGAGLEVIRCAIAAAALGSVQAGF
jgi:hypothetical protein